MPATLNTTIEFRYWRVWPLPLWVIWMRVGKGRREWMLATPWGYV
jgi:hypothetical protein